MEERLYGLHRVLEAISRQERRSSQIEHQFPQESVLDMKPDVVVVATGATPMSLDMTPLGQQTVMFFRQVM